MIFNIIEKEIITSGKNSKKKKINSLLLSNKTKQIKKLKKCYKIKSSEKTYEAIKFISNKPNYINLTYTNTNTNVNTITNTNTNANTNANANTNTNIFNLKIPSKLDQIKNYKNDVGIKKITHCFLKTKQEFYNLFVNNDNSKYFINDLNDFELFHKNNILTNTYLNSNILIKFYNDDKTYIYIYVNQNKMIKIINDFEYDNICSMIEKNNGIFILVDTNITNNYIIGYGSYTQSNLNLEDIRKIFFSNISNYKTNKNYKILSEFKYIKIYFYVCNETF